MSSYGKQTNFKKIVSYESKKNSEKIFKLNIELIHQIFNTINISFLCLIFILFFLSFDSQRKWSNTYQTLSKTKAMNNNIIDYISNIELMSPYDKQSYLKKKFIYESKKNSEKIFKLNIKLFCLRNIVNEIIIHDFCFG